MVLSVHLFSLLFARLPRKTDMERKIEIVQFAHRTRQLFVRLLALVKWAKNGCKIDKCMVGILLHMYEIIENIIGILAVSKLELIMSFEMLW